MNLPRKWTWTRPGFLIPVFFLSFYQGSGQMLWQESSVMATGNCFASRCCMTNGMYNQAGLGWIDSPSLSIHHTRPFLIGELGISGVSFQLPVHRGGFGTTISTIGITGMRQMAAWTGFGLVLHPGITAGAGLYFQDYFAVDIGHHFGAGCALGIQMKIRDGLILGAHISHPVSWVQGKSTSTLLPMTLSTGMSYTFFKTATYHTDLHFGQTGRIQWSHGLEVYFTKAIRLLLGICNAPTTLSGGISTEYSHWKITMAAACCFDTGTTPSCSLAYAW
jgi:hypothetical protein